MNATATTTPRLYVGTYAKYNNGSIQGAWMDLDSFSDADEFIEAIKELHSDEEDPEFMFQDYEGFPECFYSESMSTKEIEQLYEYLNMDEEDRELLTMYAEATGYSIEDIDLSDAQDAFHGTADSEAGFAEQIAEECGEIPKDMPSWIVIDWEASWKCNLRHDYNTATADDGTIWFFFNR
nr:antirestriction protein ArdA [uncultured Flavobacterium sp.]